MSAYDVIIVGGGLIGSSIAFQLSTEKLRVLLLDRQEPGREASWAAAGMLAPGPDSSDATALVPLGIESLRLYPEFVAAIEKASVNSTDFTRTGTFEVFRGPRAEAQRDAMVAEFRRLAIGAEAISLNDARKHEPSLATHEGAIAWLPDEATIDPRLLIESVLAAARQSGAEIRANCAVNALLYEREACAGVIAGGQKIAAKQVIIAAGSFCSTINDAAHEANSQRTTQLRQYAPVHPVRGQMLALRSATVRLKKFCARNTAIWSHDAMAASSPAARSKTPASQSKSRRKASARFSMPRSIWLQPSSTRKSWMNGPACVLARPIFSPSSVPPISRVSG